MLNDGLNYELDTGKTHKQHRTYHINLLSKWQSRDEIAALVSPQICLCHMNGMSLNLRQKKHGKTLSCRTSYPSLKISGEEIATGVP